MAVSTAGKKIDPGLRQRLLNQRKAMSTGLIIANKGFLKGIFRILPAKAEETPGVEYLSLFGRAIKQGTTCPRTFGLQCPLMDWKDRINQSGSKEDRDAAYKALSIETEYWTLVVPQDDLGTVALPNIKILRAKKKLYEQITARMVDDDIGEDITDLITGRYVLVKKTGVDSATRWTADWLDKTPISDDPEYIEAVKAAAAAFNIPGRFYRVDWDRMAKIYESVTGEKMDDSYRNQEGADAGTAGHDDEDERTSPDVPAAPAPSTAKPAALKPAATKPASVAAKPAVAAKGPAKKAPEPEPEPEPAAEVEPDENGVIVEQTEVFWNDGTADVVGTVMRRADDKDGATYDVVVPVGEYGAGEWTVRPGEFTIIEPSNDDAVAEPEPEPEPEAPPAPRGPQRRAAPAAAETEAPAEVKRPAAKAAAAAPTRTTQGPAGKSLRDRVKR